MDVGLTPDVTNDSITVNGPGVYTISFSTDVIMFDEPGDSRVIFLNISINGNPILQAIYIKPLL
jgi:hypothetical protein